MIIYPDNTIETQSHRPNENWTGRTDVVFVDDASELATRIEQSAPYFSRILDGDGNLIDIVPTERPPKPPEPPSDLDTIKEIQSQVVFALVMGGLM